MIDVERVIPDQNDSRQKSEQVEEMFDNIAGSYDSMNRIMSLGMDLHWRKDAIKRLSDWCRTANIESPRVLDLACGTADFSIAVAKEIAKARIIGVDLSAGMLAVGRRKVADENLNDRIELCQCDCLELPFADESFDCVTAAFGVRNFQDLAKGYSEMLRVVRRGGAIWILESSYPTSKAVRPFYNFYAGHIIPAVASILGKNDKAYRYLPASIRKVPSGDDMATLITAAGFREAAVCRYFMGVCSLYTAKK